MIGFGIGVSRRRRIAGAIWGFFGGGLIGGLAATIVSLPQNIPLALIGAAVLLLGGIVVLLVVLRRRAKLPDDQFEAEPDGSDESPPSPAAPAVCAVPAVPAKPAT